MAVHRYWRLHITQVTSDNTRVNIPTVEMRSVSDGSNLSVSGNGTPSASSEQATYPASQAFDANSTTMWWSSDAVGLPQWIQWDFGTATDISQIIVRNSNSGSDSFFIRAGSVQWSDNGSSWTTIHTFSGLPVLVSSVHTFDFVEPVTATGAVTFPAAQATGYGGANGAMTLPAATVSAAGGAVAALVMPAITAVGYGGANGTVTSPMPTLYAAGHDSTGENAFAHTMTAPALSAYGGANAALTCPAMTLDAEGTAPVMANAHLVMPAPTLQASGTPTALGSAALTMKPSMFSLIGYGGAVCSISIGGVTVEASGTTGAVGNAAVTLPLFELTATATTQIVASAALVMPAVSLGVTGRAWLIAPGFTLTAIGTAVVTATYEAYSLTLKHEGDGPLPLTRYTNFPFDRIVRYRGSYYGVAADGLYLLEGTTDFAEPTPTPIEWDWRTCLTDFGTPNKKTPVSAYFGGRLGPEATVTLVEGETADRTHSFETPRGSDAQNYRQKFGRGVKARYFALGAAGDGELSIDSLDFNIATLARRI